MTVAFRKPVHAPSLILVISANANWFVLAGVTASYFTRFLLLVSWDIVHSDILLCIQNETKAKLHERFSHSMLPSIRTLKTKIQFLRRSFQLSVNKEFRMKAEHFGFKMKVLAS